MLQFNEARFDSFAKAFDKARSLHEFTRDVCKTGQLNYLNPIWHAFKVKACIDACDWDSELYDVIGMLDSELVMFESTINELYEVLNDKCGDFEVISFSSIEDEAQYDCQQWYADYGYCDEQNMITEDLMCEYKLESRYNMPQSVHDEINEYCEFDNYWKRLNDSDSEHDQLAVSSYFVNSFASHIWQSTRSANICNTNENDYTNDCKMIFAELVRRMQS